MALRPNSAAAAAAQVARQHIALDQPRCDGTVPSTHAATLVLKPPEGPRCWCCKRTRARVHSVTGGCVSKLRASARARVHHCCAWLCLATHVCGGGSRV